MAKYFMGIDVGTYESKGVLVDENANVVAYHSCAHKMEVPQPGYAEHDADAVWWGDLCTLSRRLLATSQVDPKEICAVGCSAIAPCCLPVDRALRPLRKGILYGIDCRATEEISFLEQQYGAQEIFRRCGTPLTTQSAAAKILWLKNHEPEVYANTYKFLTSTSYMVAKLTGKFVIDHYTAATWVPIYDIEKLDWCDEPELFCRREQLAACRWSDEIAGTVTEEAARATGLAVGTPVTTGTADASAEALSVGVLEPGDMMCMYGSSIFLIHVVPALTTDPRLWAGPYLFRDTYCVAAGMSCAGTLTRWFRDNLALDLVQISEANGSNLYENMINLAQDIPAGSDGLIVLPYFSGERTPINDPLAKGMIFGLNLRHTRGHIYKAILESIGYGIRQHFDIFAQKQMHTKKIMAVGGGTKNPVWLQAVSDICEKTQQLAAVELGACYGDALLASLAAGFYPDSRALAQKIRTVRDIAPNAQTAHVYRELCARYAALYQSTRQIMHSF